MYAVLISKQKDDSLDVVWYRHLVEATRALEETVEDYISEGCSIISSKKHHALLMDEYANYIEIHILKPV